MLADEKGDSGMAARGAGGGDESGWTRTTAAGAVFFMKESIQGAWTLGLQSPQMSCGLCRVRGVVCQLRNFFFFYYLV